MREKVDRVRLESDRLLLRPVAPADVTPRYVGWLNDPEVNRYLETRFQTQTLESVARYVRQMQAAADSLFLALVLKDRQEHIGNIKLGPVSWPHRRAELSFFIGEKDCWGRGLASEAVALLTGHGLSAMGLHKVTSGCYHTNYGSRRVFEKCGFQLEAMLKRHYRGDNGWLDRCCYGRWAEAEPVGGETR